jgi:hypothetical protein
MLSFPGCALFFPRLVFYDCALKKAAGTGQKRQREQDRSSRTGQQGQVSRDRSAGTGQPEPDSQTKQFSPKQKSESVLPPVRYRYRTFDRNSLFSVTRYLVKVTLHLKKVTRTVMERCYIRLGSRFKVQ